MERGGVEGGDGGRDGEKVVMVRRWRVRVGVVMERGAEGESGDGESKLGIQVPPAQFRLMHTLLSKDGAGLHQVWVCWETHSGLI